MYISYLPPKGYPDQLSITLMDGRSVRLEQGRHTYAPDVVERLQSSAPNNSTLVNLINQQIIIIESPKPAEEFVPLYDSSGAFMGHFPVQRPITNEYDTGINTPPDAVAPPMQAVMQSMPGYYPMEAPIPGVTGAPSYTQPISNMNQYTVGSGQLPIQNNDVNTVVNVATADDIFRYDGAKMTPTGNFSAIRANGQVSTDELNSPPISTDQIGRPSPFQQSQQPAQQPAQQQQFIQQQPAQQQQFIQQQPAQQSQQIPPNVPAVTQQYQEAPVVTQQDTAEPVKNVQKPKETVGTGATGGVRKTTKKRRGV